MNLQSVGGKWICKVRFVIEEANEFAKLPAEEVKELLENVKNIKEERLRTIV
jgi:DNA-directed RNA polymerase subunit F